MSATDRRPHVVILAGPNGAGKSTAAPALLRGALGVDEFVNADVIAAGLSGFHPDGAAIEAGRVMLTHLKHLADCHANFAFETTLSGRTVARFLDDLHGRGYDSHLVYLWLPSANFAVERVHTRVTLGGHDVPQDTIQRRYEAGLQNFFRLYRPLVKSWHMYDGSAPQGPVLVARGVGVEVTEVARPTLWQHIVAVGSQEGESDETSG